MTLKHNLPILRRISLTEHFRAGNRIFPVDSVKKSVNVTFRFNCMMRAFSLLTDVITNCKSQSKEQLLSKL